MVGFYASNDVNFTDSIHAVDSAECEWVRFSTEVLLQGFIEDAVSAGGPGEQRHARLEFHVVRRTEDFVNRPAPHGADKLDAFAQTRPQHGVFEVRTGFVDGGDRECSRQGTVSQAFDL